MKPDTNQSERPPISEQWARLREELQGERTARERAEAALNSIRQQVEQAVQQRTAELVRGNQALHAELAQRRQAEQEARLSEERFRALVEKTEDFAIFMLDPQGRVASWNSGAQRITGYTREEILHQHARLWYLDEAIRSGEPERELQQALQDGHSLTEGRRVRKDGSTFWATVATTALRDASGAHQGFAQIMRDVTDRKHAEERFRLAVEAAPNAMVMIAQDGRMTLVNSQAERLFGYPREELLGYSVEMLVPQRFRSSHAADRQAFLTKPQTRPMGAGRDLFGVRKDGTEVPLEIGLNPLRTSEGTFVLASIIDITERKRTEEMIQNSLREKEILLQEIHHRVKNNMQVISSLLQLQSGYLQDPRAAEAFRESQGRIRSMSLIHEKLYQSDSLAWIDLAEYLQSLVGMLVRTYAPRANTVRVETRVQPVFLSLDAAIPVGLVTHELVSNCFKYAFPNGRRGTITVALESLSETASALTVSDDGIGLPPDFSLESTSTLGLRLVQMFTRQLGGSLALHREDGRTAFVLQFNHRAKETPHALEQTTDSGRGR